jgi:hypothetical protein
MHAPRAPGILALLIGAALVQGVLAGHACAEDLPALGNGLQPVPVNPSTAGAWMAEDGMGTREPAARSPAGRYFDIPLAPVELEGLARSASGWRSFGFVEFGAIGLEGDRQAQGFRAHKDVTSGPAIPSFGALAEQPDQARYVEVVGSSVGQRDQSYGLWVGRYNDWKFSVYYDETPHVYTTTYRSLWSGAGTDRLTLEQGLPPGGSASAAATQTSVRNALAATEYSELGVQRNKAGMRFDKNLTESWRFFASLSEERRQGARPFGAVFGGGGGGGNFEVPESIDYTTRDFVAGAHYRDAVNRFNVQATASIFRNNVDAMTFDNPLYVSLNGVTGLTSNSFTHGRFDLAPGNEHYHLKGEYGRSLPGFYKANFTATAALGSMRQDEALLPPSPYALTGGAAQGVSLANNWNTASALSRPSADARIDTRLADLGLSLKPAQALTVKGKLRYYETKNHTEYWACNPLTGQWGRLLNDGTGVSFASANTMAGVNPVGTTAGAYNAAACDPETVQAMSLVPAAGNIPIRSIPFDYRQVNAGVSADYRLGKASNVNAALERETYRRDHREREKTWEDKLKLAYVNRGVIDGTVRVSVGHDRRRGSEFVADPYTPFLSAGFGPQPTTDGVNMTSWLRYVAQMQRFDLADRDQNVVNARVNYLFNPGLEGAVTLQWKDARFPAEVGRAGRHSQGSLAFDFDYKAGPKLVLYGFYAYQAGNMEQLGVQPYACVMGQTYYFYSNGQVLAPATIGGAAPATPAGTTLVATQTVTTANWESVCGSTSATSPLFPESRAWEVRSKDRNDALGVGLRYDFGRMKLDASFSRSLARTRIGYSYNPAALGVTATQQALAGAGFSDLRFAQNVFSLSVLVPIDKQMSVRFFERYESGAVRDWHYDGVAANPMPVANAAYLDAGPQDYSVNVFGVLLLIRL